MYHALAHSYGSPPASTVSPASTSACSVWSSTKRSMSAWAVASRAPISVVRAYTSSTVYSIELAVRSHTASFFSTVGSGVAGGA